VAVELNESAGLALEVPQGHPKTEMAVIGLGRAASSSITRIYMPLRDNGDAGEGESAFAAIVCSVEAVHDPPCAPEAEQETRPPPLDRLQFG
jgi:hypothetical protein